MIVLAVSASCSDGSADRPASAVPDVSGITGEQEAALVAKAEEMAFYDDEPSPTRPMAVETTWEQVVGAGLGDAGVWPSDRGVFVASLEGAFVGHMAKVPSGGDAPTGRYLWFIMDAERLEVEAWGLGDVTVDLMTLGEPFSLPIDTPITEASIG